MNPILLGYFPKQLLPSPEWMSARGIEEVASVSLCIAGGPPAWIQAWKHNEWGLFASPEIAWSLVPDDQRADYRLYAYGIYPVRFVEGREVPMEIAPTDARAFGFDYVRVGWDVVSRSAGADFECSPLTCNMLAEQMETNRYGLFADLDDALELARTADEMRCEPGPYHVLGVWREGGGD